MLDALPRDLHPHVVLHDFEEDLLMYPAAYEAKRKYPTHGPGPCVGYFLLILLPHISCIGFRVTGSAGCWNGI